MLSGSDGLPDPNRRERLVTGAAGPVELEIGPAGDLFYVDLLGGKVHRIVYTPGDQAPTAVASASRTSGAAPLTVDFDASGSSDPDPGDTISYAWDFTSDGAVDSTATRASFTYRSAGRYLATLRVTDDQGLSWTDAVAITVGNTSPAVTIDAPSPSSTWRIGDRIQFSGHATDAEDGNLPAVALRWSLALHHCATPTDCHVHPLQDFAGVASGSFVAPDHDYPSWLELRLSGTDSGGLTDAVSVRLDARAVNLTFASSPSGLVLAVGSQAGTAPLTRTVIAGSTISVGAPWPQTLSGAAYAFSSWSDGGAQSHTVTAPDVPTTYTARYARYTPAYWYLRNANSTGSYQTKVAFGQAGDTPVVGDWNADGTDTVGTFRDGSWWLRNSNTSGPYELEFRYGGAGDRPVVGDWDGDGDQTAGVFRSGVWYLRNGNSAGGVNVKFSYGWTSDIPVVGDWNGDGIDTPGVFRSGVWYLRNANSAGQADVKFGYGKTGDIPVVGDWNGDGIDTVGVIRNGVWYLRNGNSAGGVNVQLTYGSVGQLPVVGDWNGDGTTTIGTFR